MAARRLGWSGFEKDAATEEETRLAERGTDVEARRRRWKGGVEFGGGGGLHLRRSEKAMKGGGENGGHQKENPICRGAE